MNEKIKTKWIAALKGDDYKRGHGQLRISDGFNLFGVLCDLHAKATDGEWELPPDSKIDWAYLGSRCHLPHEVIKWAGIKLNGLGHLVVWNGKEIDLTNMDIEAATFLEMADILEEFA